MLSTSKYIRRILKWLVSNVARIVLSLIVVGFLLPILINGWQMLQTYWRVLLDAFSSGFVRGTPFQNADGSWAVAWRLGGQPFVLVAIPFVFGVLSIVGATVCIFYLSLKWRSFSRLRKICTYLRHPKNFRSSISVRFVAAILSFIIFSGLLGLGVIGPQVFVPDAKPSDDFLWVTSHVSASVSITISRHAIVGVNPSIFDTKDTNDWLYCTIEAPENAFWKVNDIDTSSIMINRTVPVGSAEININDDGASTLIAKFQKNLLLPLFVENGTVRFRTVTLTLTGRLFENGDFFEGKAVIEVV